VTLDRPLTLVLCALIVVGAWLTAAVHGCECMMIAIAGAITLLCAAVALHHVKGPKSRAVIPGGCLPLARDEGSDFRRNLFNLCAALKLGLRFCEDHLHAEPEALIEQLQQMSDNINAFVNEATRPVRFCERAPWPWRLSAGRRVRWPWRANPHRRTPS